MKKIFFLIISFLINLVCLAQYWQQQADFIIDVTLNDQDKSLDGFEKISYTNHSPDTLTYIWFHLFPNAFKNDKTAFSDQMLENGNTRFYFSSREERGYINRLDFKVNGVTANTEDHPEHIDITRLILPKPLAPGEQVIITTPFHVKLPRNFSRGGYEGNSFQISQWYPKPAVYDRNGWHPMPYLDQGEFYSEFGNYEVTIHLPKDYVVAATGLLMDEDERRWMETRKPELASPVLKKSPKSSPPKNTVKKTTNGKSFEQIEKPIEIKTLHYAVEGVHDFAWFANKNFLVVRDSCMLPNGNQIEVNAFYLASEQLQWKHSVEFAKDAVRFYAANVGTYPYPVISIVLGPEAVQGGMEYPTIAILSPASSLQELDRVIAHEIGHNWFYGIVASDERLHPWMDEGINSYYENRYMEMKYGKSPDPATLINQTKIKRETAQPIATSSEKFSSVNYAAVAYSAAAEWLKDIEIRLGTERFDSMMKEYYETWKFKHPQPDDFKNILRQFMGAEANSYISNLEKPYARPTKDFRLVSPLIKSSIKKYLISPSASTLFISPAVGINSYDKFMIGALISNYKLPPNNFQFLVIPMYGTGSKKFTGLGKLNYSMISEGKIRKTDFFLNASTFSMDDFKDTAGRKLIMQFRKLVPGIRFTFRERNPRTTVRKYVQWKTYFFREDFLRITQDTTISGTDTTLFLRYLLPQQNRVINQLQFVYENTRALYPHKLELKVEQSKDFIRPTVTANYFFNYREGGLQLRIFAGKFIYLNGKTINKQFANDRYHLNMTGANGYEDYTYSDFFVGRNRFEGLASQQIMIRDGGFKVRTDLLASKVGKTDNWLAAVNLNSTIPEKFNPLSVLPIKIPLRIFMDLGTYAEAWERNSEEDRILYDLGLQISILNETVNIYLPVLYNKIYGDYFKSTIPKNRFFKTMSFTINLFHPAFKKLNQELEF